MKRKKWCNIKVVYRFFRKTKTNLDDLDVCWEWIGGLTKDNGLVKYGNFWDGNKQIKAHRFSYIYFKGEIPKGKLVLHTCDNMQCVNPRHLKIGTPLDNMVDRELSGHTARGRKHGSYKNGHRVGELRKNYVYKTTICGKPRPKNGESV